jgi:hypothetical protein
LSLYLTMWDVAEKRITNEHVRRTDARHHDAGEGEHEDHAVAKPKLIVENSDSSNTDGSAPVDAVKDEAFTPVMQSLLAVDTGGDVLSSYLVTAKCPSFTGGPEGIDEMQILLLIVQNAINGHNLIVSKKRFTRDSTFELLKGIPSNNKQIQIEDLAACRFGLARRRETSPKEPNDPDLHIKAYVNTTRQAWH